MLKEIIQKKLAELHMTEWCLAAEFKEHPQISYWTILRFFKGKQDISCSKVELLLDYLDIELVEKA